MEITKKEKEKLVTELDVHGNQKIYEVFKKLGFNDVHSVVFNSIENQKIVYAMKNTLKDDSSDYWLEKKDWAQDGEELRSIFNELLYGKITTDSNKDIKEIQSQENVKNE